MVQYNKEKLFEKARLDICCNTSYPYRRGYFGGYLTDMDIMKEVSELSLYFHIPFCKSLCRFCEYTRFLADDISLQNHYVEILERQVSEYLDDHPVKFLYGLDIGGGTPTALTAENLERVLTMVRNIIQHSHCVSDFEPSIEFSYQTLDERKTELIGEYGFTRVSTGIQVYDTAFLKKENRHNPRIETMRQRNEYLKQCGIQKINLDLMYGMQGQTDVMLKAGLAAVEALEPEQVTLYEMRYNQVDSKDSDWNRDTLFDAYNLLFEALIKMGYQARFGQNTFSKNVADEGVSSYLRYRMGSGIPYKGFGVSAQSMSDKGISYNSLKGSSELHMPQIERIKEIYTYLLLPEEIAAKYVCIALYSGRFRFSALSRLLGTNAKEYFAEELSWLLNHDYIRLEDDFCQVTKAGFRYYGAVAALFWSPLHKKRYLEERKEC
jgi:oxygen-independent coproporphyrinogen-3 oxidase